MKKAFIFYFVILSLISVKNIDAMSVLNWIKQNSTGLVAKAKKILPGSLVTGAMLETAAFNKGKKFTKRFGYNLAKNGLLFSAFNNLKVASSSAFKGIVKETPVWLSFLGYKRTGIINPIKDGLATLKSRNIGINYCFSNPQLVRSSILNNHELMLQLFKIGGNILCAVGKVSAVGLLHKYMRPRI